MPDAIRSDERHLEAEELLPWYVTGQLEESDRSFFENHLASCARCQRALAAERLLIDQYLTIDKEIDESWSRLQARIAPRPRPVSAVARAASEFRDLLRRPGVAMLAAAQLSFVLVGGALLLSLTRPDYHALGGPGIATDANIIVIFRSDATADDLRDTLRKTHASLVGGPTSTGAYLVHVSSRDRPDALTRLRSDDDVEMAEPIDGTAE